jgi:outer membrane protein TolC
MKNRLKLLLIGFSLVGLQVTAQEKRPITLSEAVDLGIKNSKQLKNSQAKIEEATAALKEALNNQLPDAKLSASYLWLSSANVDMKIKSNNSGGGGGSVPTISRAGYAIANASVPLFAGGRIRYGIEASRFLEQATRLDADNDKEQVIQNTIEAFVNLYKAKASVSLVQENLAEAQQRVKDFSNLEKNGLLARNDLLSAQLQASNFELGLLDAENNWKLANVSMNILLGLPENLELVPDSSMIDQSFAVRTLDEYLQAAYTSRKDLAALDLRKKASESSIKSAKGDYYPSLAVTGGYIAVDIPEVISITNALNIGVGVSYNIGSLWKTKAKVQQAEARAKQAAIGESQLNDDIRLDVNHAYLNFLSSQKKIEVYGKAVEQAIENYRIVKNKYNNSLETTTDLLDANTKQLLERMNLIFAKADAVVAYNKLLQAAGLLEETTKQQ